MSAPRRWARRAVLSALAGGGLTAAGFGGPFVGGALGAETPAGTTGTTESPTPPVTETSPQAPAPTQGEANPTTTSTTPAPSTAPPAPSSTSTSTVPSSGTATTPSAPTPAEAAQGVPTVVVQHSQQTTPGRRRGASVTGAGAGKGGARGGGTGASKGADEGAAKSAPGTVPAGTPNGVALAPLVAGGELNSTLPLATLLAGSAVSAQALDFYRIPLFLLPVYQAAAFQYDVPWQILAAINEVETDYGTDLSVSTAGAVGWMQFMPATWLQYGVDATDGGLRRPLQPRGRDLRCGALPACGRRLPQPAQRDLRLQPLSGIRRIGVAARTPDRQLSPCGGRHAHRPRRWASADCRRPPRPRGECRPGRGTAAGGCRERIDRGAPPWWEAPLRRVAPPAPPRVRYLRPRPRRPRPLGQLATGSAPGSKPPPPPRVAAARAEAVANAAAKASQLVDLLGRPGAPVVAVEDGRIVHLGHSHAFGRYLVLRDIYGDVFTYAGLGSIAPRYRPSVPRVHTQPATDTPGGASASTQGGPQREGPIQSGATQGATQSGATQGGASQSSSAQPDSAQGGEPAQDPAPTLPATAGHQRPLTLKVRAHAAHSRRSAHRSNPKAKTCPRE